MADNIIRLATVNDTVQTEGKAANELVVAFLREYADEIERGERDADRAVLVLHQKGDNGTFSVSSRRCNADFLTAVALLHLALTDLSTCPA